MIRLTFITIIALSLSSVCDAQLLCSNQRTLDVASKLAVDEDFQRAQTGMNILLSLQSKPAKAALSRLQIRGEAQHEIWSYYLAHYSEKPKEDNAGDPIQYLSCADIQKLLPK